MAVPSTLASSSSLILCSLDFLIAPALRCHRMQCPGRFEAHHCRRNSGPGCCHRPRCSRTHRFLQMSPRKMFELCCAFYDEHLSSFWFAYVCFLVSCLWHLMFLIASSLFFQRIFLPGSQLMFLQAFSPGHAVFHCCCAFFSSGRQVFQLSQHTLCRPALALLNHREARAIETHR